MIYVSSSCVPADTIKEAVETLAIEGCKNIELSGGTNYYNHIMEDLIALKDKYGLSYLVHNYFPPPDNHFILNISSVDKTLRNKSVKFVKKSLFVAHKLKSTLYALHPGYTKDLILDENNEHFIPCSNNYKNKIHSLEILEKCLRILCNEAKSYGLIFGVENLFPLPDNNFSLLCEEWEIDWLFKRCADIPNLGLLLDLGHAKISSKLLNFDLNSFLEPIVNKYRHRLLGIHLSDNSGLRDDHFLPERDSWMLSFIMKNNLNHLPITLESRNSSFDEILDYYQYLNEELGGTNDKR